MKIGKQLALFTIGGGGYVGLELTYRGYSHISMFGAGGLCFLLLGRLGRRQGGFLGKALAGAGAITCVEFLTGLLVNRNFQVWDYRRQWGNVLGQICPAFTAIWIPIAALGMGLYALADRGLDRVMKKS